MIRVGLYNEDRDSNLLPLHGLSIDFQVASSSTEAAFTHLLATVNPEMLVLCLDADEHLLPQQVAYFKRVVDIGIPCIIVVDENRRTEASELVRHGAYGYCETSASASELTSMLHQASKDASFKLKPLSVAQPDSVEEPCGKLIGSTPQMQNVYNLVRRVSNISASVLVTGESGTGKELIANAIHQLSASSAKPWVAVSCGAIPETLIESELFGHDRGAFTGSTESRTGYLEHAGDGTLFLDEIADLSLSTQVKLLRVLQQREFSPLGSSRLIPLRARIIFATHKDLESMVAAQTFRHDLYYRINVIRIEAPTLRERIGDLPQLAAHFLRHYSDLYGKPIATIDRHALNALQTYHWPGNVRELENVIQRAIILSNGDSITTQCLPTHILPHVAFPGEGVLNIGDYQPGSSFESKVRDFKFNIATNAIRENNGNKTVAARALRISRAYLHRLIRGNDSEEFVEEPDGERETA
jgi:DNA-binding NtrC family response regulator